MSFDVAPQTIIDSLGFGHCLFFGSLILAVRRRNPANIYLAAFMFTYAIVCVGELFLGASSWPEIRFFLVPMDALLPPFIYLYVVELTSPPAQQFQTRRLCHLLTAGVAFLLMLPWMTLPAELKDLPIALDLGWVGTLETALGLGIRPERLFDNETAPTNLIAAAIGVLLFVGLFQVQVTVYVLGIIVIFLEHRKRIKQNFSYIDNVKLQWLGILCAAFVVMWVTVVPVGIQSFASPTSESVSLAQGMAQLAVLYVLGFAGMRQPVVYPLGDPWVLAESGENRLIPAPDDRATNKATKARPPNNWQKYARSGLSKEDMTRIATKLDHAMIRDRLFMDSMLTLPQLAKQTGISTNHITQVINEHLGKNFFDFVNGFRVEEAKHELLAHDETVLDIAFAVGFNSKSTFNATFKKLVGQTPSQFRSQERAQLIPNVMIDA